jgi:hypothetical protein
VSTLQRDTVLKQEQDSVRELTAKLDMVSAFAMQSMQSFQPISQASSIPARTIDPVSTAASESKEQPTLPISVLPPSLSSTATASKAAAPSTAVSVPIEQKIERSFAPIPTVVVSPQTPRRHTDGSRQSGAVSPRVAAQTPSKLHHEDKAKAQSLTPARASDDSRDRAGSIRDDVRSRSGSLLDTPGASSVKERMAELHAKSHVTQERPVSPAPGKLKTDFVKQMDLVST